MLNSLTDEERTVFKMVAWSGGDFAKVAQELGMDSESQAEAIFERARLKVVREVYGEPDDGWVSLVGIKEALGLSTYRVTRLAAPYRSSSIRCSIGPGRNRKVLFPPVIFNKIKVDYQHFKSLLPLGENLSTPELELRTGISHHRIPGLLVQVGVVPERRLNRINRDVTSWPPESEEVLLELKVPLAGDRYSLTALQREVGRSRDWIAAQLRTISDTGEVRQPLGGGWPTLHYLKATCSELKRRASMYPPAGEMLNRSQIRAYFGRSSKWTDSRIAATGLKPEPRLDCWNRVRPHYSPSIIPAIEELVRNKRAA